MNTNRRLGGIIRSGCVVAALCMVMAGAAGAGPFDAWANRMQITFTGYNKPGVLTNFPVLVVLTNGVGSGFSYRGFESATGGDLRFAASNETDVLSYEIEKWDTNGASYVWVQVPVIAGTGDCIYAYWGNTNTTPTPGTIWDTNYVGVWHMAVTNTPDATTNAGNGTAVGSVTPVAGGMVDGACDFDADTDYVQVPDNAAFTLGSCYTVSAWIKSDPLTGWEGIAGTYNGSNGFILALDQNVGSYLQFFAGGTWLSSSYAMPDEVWKHVAYAANGPDGRFYVNGVQVRTVSAKSVADGGELQLGAGGAGWTATYRFDGGIDEVRISNTQRGSNWLWACWANQTTNQTLLSYGQACFTATKLTVKALAPTVPRSDGTTANGQIVHAGGAENPVVYVCWAYTNAGTSGGTSAWANAGFVGTNWGAGQFFSTNLTGLQSGSNYTYRFYVTNSTGEDWSDEARSFQTIYLPAVTNPGATSVGASGAILQGQVTDTGLETPSAWFEYWLTGNASTTTVARGTQTGAFSATVTGLEPSSSYAYRAAASNSAGVSYSGTRAFNTGVGTFVALSGNDADGASWATAYTNLQTAVDAAGVGAVIFVKADTFGRTNQIDLSGKVNLSIRGGYEGTGPEPGPLAAGPSILERTGSGSARLFFGNTTTATLERLYIRGGSLTNNPSYGGGLLFTNQSRVTLRSCTLATNQCYVQGTQEGGGIYVSGGSLTLENCTLIGNRLPKSDYTTISRGGAIRAVNAAVSVSNTFFQGNYVHSRHYDSFGGALCVSNGTCVIDTCTFATNWAQGDTYSGDTSSDFGGAVHLDGVAPFRISDCSFAGNYTMGVGSTRLGDVLYVRGTAASGLVVRCVAIRNGTNSTNGGEAQFHVAGGSLRLENVLAVKGWRGSAVRQAGGALEAVNCTFADNQLWGLHGNASPTSSVLNCIARGNAGGGITNATSVAYTCSQESQAGDGNLVSDPFFVDATYYHLQSKAGNYVGGYFSGGTWGVSDADSRCINAGALASPYDAEPWPNGRRVNMGAYGNTGTASLSHLRGTLFSVR